MIRHFRATASRVLRRSVAIGLLVLAVMLMAMSAGAQELDPNSPPPVRDYVSCGHFESQIDAQVVLDSGNLDELGRQSLDGDGDGIACDEAFGLDPNSAPPATDYTSCGHFESQQSAQEVLDTGVLEDPSILDGDGDGIACEDAFAADPAADTASTPAPAIRLPNTGSGAAAVASADTGALALVAMSGGALMLRRHLASR
jgi:hypothetical protein